VPGQKIGRRWRFHRVIVNRQLRMGDPVGSRQSLGEELALMIEATLQSGAVVRRPLFPSWSRSSTASWPVAQGKTNASESEVNGNQHSRILRTASILDGRLAAYRHDG
jgi:hypothetical protein